MVGIFNYTICGGLALKKINIGVNCLSFDVSKKNGALEVLMNLSKGWGELGYDYYLTFFCYEEHARQISALCPNAVIVKFKNKITGKHRGLETIKLQTCLFHSIYKKYDLDMIFFTLTSIGWLKYDVPVVLIPHDIQVVSHPDNYFTHSVKDKIEYLFNYLEYKRNFKILNKIIAISDIDKKEIETYYPFTQNKLVKIYDPIGKEIPDVINISKRPYIMATNIQYKHKNILTLVKAFELFHRKKKQYKLYLVGKESKATQELHDYIRQHKLEGCIKFLGYISDEELIRLWADTSLYVNPSLYEGFGMTSVESLMMGAPTLLSDIQVHREVTENLAFYFKNLFDYQELAEIIENIVDMPLREDVLKKNSMIMRKKYDYKMIAQQYWNTFNIIIDKG